MPDGGGVALLDLRLRSVTYEAEGINSYVLEPLAGQALPPFAAGAHIDLHLADGMIRSYSLLNDPRDAGRYVVAVQHDRTGRGGSRIIHERLRVGDVLAVGAPRNSFPLQEDAADTVLIAGGIGITPLLSMAERLVAIGRPWTLHYAARTTARTAFRDRLAKLAGDAPGRLHYYHDGEPGGTTLDIGAAIAHAAPGAHLYCCGPAPMLAAFEAAAASRPAAQVHVEYFAAKAAAAVTGGYEVMLARSGQTVAVAAGQTMLAALLDAGANVSFSCSEGLCGTCEVAVLSGEPDHRDQYLTDAERAANASVMPCCSGSRSARLILDL